MLVIYSVLFGYIVNNKCHCSLAATHKKILWLKVSSSNNNSAYIAHFFSDCVHHIESMHNYTFVHANMSNTNSTRCPKLLRADLVS